MRHKVAKKNFGRRSGARKALIKGLVDALVKEERIKTTLPKAKELRKHVERAITKGKAGTVHARRVLLKSYPNVDTMEKIVDDLSVRFKDRPGGYTRIRKLGNRPGDQAPVAYIEFVDYKPALKDEEWVQSNEKRMEEEKTLHAKRADKLRKNKRKIQEQSRAYNFVKSK